MCLYHAWYSVLLIPSIPMFLKAAGYRTANKPVLQHNVVKSLLGTMLLDRCYVFFGWFFVFFLLTMHGKYWMLLYFLGVLSNFSATSCRIKLQTAICVMRKSSGQISADSGITVHFNKSVFSKLIPRPRLHFALTFHWWSIIQQFYVERSSISAAWHCEFRCFDWIMINTHI